MGDKILFGCAIFLLIFGFLALMSVSVLIVGPGGDVFYFVKRQVFLGLGIGILGFLVTWRTYYRGWKRFSGILFAIAILLLLLVFVPGLGRTVSGARRWLQVGGFFSFQPAEILKLALIMYLAAWLENRQKDKTGGVKNSILPLVFVLAGIGFIFWRQPDVGTFGVILASAIAALWVGGIRVKQLLGVIAIFLILGAIFIFTSPYRIQRVKLIAGSGLNPQKEAYQLEQALLNIGSGGAFGKGLSGALQTAGYVPELMSDFIFTMIAKEFGFLGGVGLVILFLIFVLRSLQIAKNTDDVYGRVLAAGIGSFIFIQALVHILSNLKFLMPPTGIPLPFISYGGTDLAIALTSLGILLNIAKNNT